MIAFPRGREGTRDRSIPVGSPLQIIRYCVPCVLCACGLVKLISEISFLTNAENHTFDDHFTIRKAMSTIVNLIPRNKCMLDFITQFKLGDAAWTRFPSRAHHPPSSSKLYALSRWTLHRLEPHFRPLFDRSLRLLGAHFLSI